MSKTDTQTDSIDEIFDGDIQQSSTEEDEFLDLIDEESEDDIVLTGIDPAMNIEDDKEDESDSLLGNDEEDAVTESKSDDGFIGFLKSPFGIVAVAGSMFFAVFMWYQGEKNKSSQSLPAFSPADIVVPDAPKNQGVPPASPAPSNPYEAHEETITVAPSAPKRIAVTNPANGLQPSAPDTSSSQPVAAPQEQAPVLTMAQSQASETNVPLTSSPSPAQMTGPAPSEEAGSGSVPAAPISDAQNADDQKEAAVPSETQAASGEEEGLLKNKVSSDYPYDPRFDVLHSEIKAFRSQVADAIRVTDERVTSLENRLSAQLKRMEEQNQQISHLIQSINALKAAPPAKSVTPKKAVVNRPAYKVVGAGQGVAWVKSRRTGSPVKIEIGDRLYGWGQVIEIRPNGDIRTVHGWVSRE